MHLLLLLFNVKYVYDRYVLWVPQLRIIYGVEDNTNIPREFNAESDGEVSSRKSRGRE